MEVSDTCGMQSGIFLVALSGGPDSVALLRMLIDKGHKVEAAHCNFHLRGKESNRDEAFCKTLCEKLGVKLHIAHFDTKEFAKLRGISIEMAARDLALSVVRATRARHKRRRGVRGSPQRRPSGDHTP